MFHKLFFKVNEYDKYIELRDRPDSWSEKKASLGLYSSNKEPLGSRKRPQEEEPPIFDQAAWGDWRPTSKEQAVADYRSSMRRGVQDVKDMVENFNGKRGDAEYAEVLFYGNTYKQS